MKRGEWDPSVAELPKHVEDFLAEHISSVSQLEALLFLRQRGGEQTVESLYRELKTSRLALSRQLGDLHDAGIVRRRGQGVDATFRYCDGEAWSTAVADLAYLYPAWQTRIARTIFRG
jgi:DNA-binding transcriptional ArsR family regulator